MFISTDFILVSEIQRELLPWYLSANIYVPRWLPVLPPDGSLFAVGGYDSSSHLATVEKYDPQVNCSKTLSSEMLAALVSQNLPVENISRQLNLQCRHVGNSQRLIWTHRATRGPPSPTCWAGAAAREWLCWTACCTWREVTTAPAAWTRWSASTRRQTPGKGSPPWTSAGQSAATQTLQVDGSALDDNDNIFQPVTMSNTKILPASAETLLHF